MPPAPPDPEKFARLGRPKRIWAIGAVHGQADQLAVLHDRIGPSFVPGDRLVYLGNVLGHGDHIVETLDEILSFRRALLSITGMLVSDVVFLRGAQEEMWQKLLQLQFAPNPVDVLAWMLKQGVAETLRAYHGDPEEGMRAAHDGAVQLTRWTNRLRDTMRSLPGHNSLFAALRRAAFPNDGGILFVSAGLDPSRPLAAQGDSFWWGGGRFSAVQGPYETFNRIVRGFDSANHGLDTAGFAVTLDAGCGRGGSLAGAVFSPDGTLLSLIDTRSGADGNSD